jgi:hypothetical protein
MTRRFLLGRRLCGRQAGGFSSVFPFLPVTQFLGLGSLIFFGNLEIWPILFGFADRWDGSFWNLEYIQRGFLTP